ncbi:MAG TPA: YdcF family protein [Saliniramus sp.]|nr:YdcF family protein [Saliniramus sp.]
MRNRRGGWLGALARVITTACLLGAAALIGGFFVFITSLNSYDNATPAQADAIVALTGGAHRVADAIDLLSRGHGERLLISGVNEMTTREEIARLNPGQRRLLECCVDLDYRARNTIGNAIETRRWVENHGFGSIIVVTSNYHMPRTMLELENAMPHIEKSSYAVVPSSIDTAAWWRDETAVRLLTLEYLKFVTAFARTLFESDPEVSRAALLLSRADGPLNMEISSEDR